MSREIPPENNALRGLGGSNQVPGIRRSQITTWGIVHSWEKCLLEASLQEGPQQHH